jgi:hypothetical protein
MPWNSRFFWRITAPNDPRHLHRRTVFKVINTDCDQDSAIVLGS